MEPTRMDGDRWKRAEDIFLAALDLPESDRSKFLDQSVAGDAVLRREVAVLLACDFDEQKLDNAIQVLAAGLADEDSWVGRRVGSYRLTAELGRGGMGVVYLAERDDQRFDKKVAIKLVTRGMDSARTRERLVAERRILANLDHPNIAKLLDGGETGDDVPYIVMEHVEGQRIDDYAASNHLTIMDRCRLVERVCDAVAYAHRNLVVHQDLKPSNILVTAEGQPKLLDFGIAGLLEDGVANQPVRGFTPDYAAPEVSAGHTVGTSADVYSLGVMLAKLCPEAPPDLAAIARLAVRADPAQRYASVGELAADLDRFVGGYAVQAHPSSSAYRAAKFVRRNRWTVAAATVAALGLGIATASALWQARRANQSLSIAETQRALAQTQAVVAETERLAAVREHGIAAQERDHAVDETRLAQQRLDQLVGLASTTVTNIQDTLEKIPGATEDRKTIVKETLQFLTRTQEQAREDPALLRTIASGYLRMGMLLGSPNRPNLGDPAGGLENVRKADTLFGDLLRKSPLDSGLQVDWMGSRRMLADFLRAAGKQEESEKVLRDVIRRGKGWVASGSTPVATELAAVYSSLASLSLDTLDPKQVSELARQAVTLLEGPSERNPSDDFLRRALASAYSSYMDSLRMSGATEESYRVGLLAAAIRESLERSHPDDVLVLRDLMLVYVKLSAVAPAPFDYAAKAVAIAERVAKLDPANRNARFDLAMALLRTGMIEPLESGRAESLEFLERAAARLEVLAKESPSPAYGLNLAIALEVASRRLTDQGQTAAALAHAERSLQTANALVAQGQSSRTVYAQVLYSLQALVPLAKSPGLADEALARAEEYTKKYPNLQPFSGRLWEAKGEMNLALGNSDAACSAFQKSVEVWSQISQPANGVKPGEPELARQKLGTCAGSR